MSKLIWTTDKINTLRDLWMNPNFSVSDIATELKTTYDAVKHALRRYNLTHYRKVKKAVKPATKKVVKKPAKAKNTAKKSAKIVAKPSVKSKSDEK